MYLNPMRRLISFGCKKSGSLQYLLNGQCAELADTLVICLNSDTKEHDIMSQALQDICLPSGTCYGCGSANPDGLQIKSYWSDDGQFVVAQFRPQERFSSGFKNAVYGGLIASLIDCHSNWTAMAFGYKADGREPGTKPVIASVTGTLSVKYLKPTPMDRTIHLKAWVEGEVGRKTRVLCELGTEDTVTAIGDSIFVRIDPTMFE